MELNFFQDILFDLINESNALNVADIESDNKKRAPSLLDTVRTVYWLIVTAAYFAWSFISGAWHISWILWIIAGILFAAINAIFNYFENKDK